MEKPHCLLFVCLHLPHSKADHSSATDIFNYIGALSRQYEVFVISFLKPHEEKFVASISGLYNHLLLIPTRRSFLEKVLRRLWALLLPEQAWQARCPRYGKALANLLREHSFDILYFEGPWMGQYMNLVRDSKVVLDEIDVYASIAERRYRATSIPWRKLWALFEWWKCKRFEVSILKRADLILTRSEKDRQSVHSLFPYKKVVVVPPWFEGLEWLECPIKISLEPTSLLFVGTMRRKANAEAVLYFYRHIWPLILQEVPQTNFYIVGADPPPSIQALAKDERVIVTGYVEDLKEYYERCSVFVAPILWGGGIIVKTLNAMALGRPVVTTLVGNEGIGAFPEEEIRVADSPAEFARKTLDLLRDKALWYKISEKGRRLVRERYSWHMTVNDLETAYRELMEQQG